MQYSRIFSVLLFLISLGFFATAAPSEGTAAIAKRGANDDAVLSIVTDLQAKVNVSVAALEVTTEATAAAAAVAEIIVNVQAAIGALAVLTPDLSEVATEAQTEIANIVVATLVIIVTIICKITIIFPNGLLVQLDVVLQAFLLALDAAIKGLLVIIIIVFRNVVIIITCWIQIQFYLVLSTLGVAVATSAPVPTGIVA